ncbi:MAG: lamin tail domain-containing protein [Minisyncoccia bacterium]
MVKINEWLPNPIGKDNQNEWIELYNDANQTINLNNWVIVSGNKTYKIKDKSINPKSFLLLNQKEMRFNLLNENGQLKLYDAQNNLIDQAKFFGQAPEGKSFSRFENNFIFSEPTPGKENFYAQTVEIIKNYPLNLPLNKIYNQKEFFIIAILIGILLSLITWYIIKNNENLKELFFK